jgi:apolipoprotein D and lipocalin family protein
MTRLRVASISLVLLAAFATTGFAGSGPASDLRTVGAVDLERYQGLWYEIARLPNRFQRNCQGSTAEYGIREDGKVSVVNTCTDPRNGEKRRVQGVARVVDSLTNAKLKVTFLPRWLRFLPFGQGDYWVIDLDADYRYAVVSEPSRKFMWVLSRTPSMDADTYQRILARAAEQGLTVGRLELSRPDSIRGRE